LLDQRAQLIEGATRDCDLLLANGLCTLQGNPIGGHQCLNILASHLYYCSDVDTRQLILLEQFDNVAEQVGRCRLVHHDFSCGWVGEMVAVGVCLIAANLIK
jgi:hypothetical protein